MFHPLRVAITIDIVESATVSFVVGCDQFGKAESKFDQPGHSKDGPGCAHRSVVVDSSGRPEQSCQWRLRICSRVSSSRMIVRGMIFTHFVSYIRMHLGKPSSTPTLSVVSRNKTGSRQSLNPFFDGCHGRGHSCSTPAIGSLAKSR